MEQVFRFCYDGIVKSLWPEPPPLIEINGDLEEGGIAARQKSGYGQFQQVWRELSPKQIPHLFVITILAIHAIKAASALALGSLAIYSIAMFIIYRDIVTGGFYALAMQALKNQIKNYEQLNNQTRILAEQVGSLREIAKLTTGNQVTFEGLLDQFREQKSSLAAENQKLSTEREKISAEIAELEQVRRAFQEERLKTSEVNQELHRTTSSLWSRMTNSVTFKNPEDNV